MLKIYQCVRKSLLQGPKTVANKYGSREATASQVFSKLLIQNFSFVDIDIDIDVLTRCSAKQRQKLMLQEALA